MNIGANSSGTETLQSIKKRVKVMLTFVVQTVSIKKLFSRDAYANVSETTVFDFRRSSIVIYCARTDLISSYIFLGSL